MKIDNDRGPGKGPNCPYEFIHYTFLFWENG